MLFGGRFYFVKLLRMLFLFLDSIAIYCTEFPYAQKLHLIVRLSSIWTFLLDFFLLFTCSHSNMLEKTLRNSEKGWEEMVRNITDLRLAKVWCRARTPISPPLPHSRFIYCKLLRTKFIQIHFNYLKKIHSKFHFWDLVVKFEQDGLWSKKGEKNIYTLRTFNTLKSNPKNEKSFDDSSLEKLNLPKSFLTIQEQHLISKTRINDIINDTVRKKPGCWSFMP